MLTRTIQRKMSEAIGATVTFGNLNLSLLSGQIDAQDLTVTATEGAPAFLAIQRLKADLSIMGALKGEIVIKSLTLERPILTLILHPDGSTNLPPRLHDALTGRRPAATPASGSPRPASPRSLKILKALVVDAEAHVRCPDSDPAYHASALGILAELHQQGGQVRFTALLDSVGRRDQPVDLGAIKASGHLTNAPDLAQLAAASLYAEADIADTLALRLNLPLVARRQGSADLRGKIDLGRLIAAAPPILPALAHLKGLVGELQLAARATYSPQDGFRLSDAALNAPEIHLPR